MLNTRRGGYRLWRRVALVCLLLIAMVWLVLPMPSLAAESPVIAAASSLNGVLKPISLVFTRLTGEQVRFSFGASGNLTRQIVQGAPFELFLSADRSYVTALKAKGLTADNGKIYATGRLVLFVSNDSPLLVGPNLGELPTLLRSASLQRLAIANPEHAPYGRAARELLQHHGLWQAMQDKLVFGENIGQAAQFGASGADAAMISQSIAQELASAGRGRYIVLSESRHSPLHHHMVLLNPAGRVARTFYDFLSQPAARQIFRKFGFSTPTTTQ